MTFREYRELALDRGARDDKRCLAIKALADFRTREAAITLLEVGSTPKEPNVVLAAAGAALASLAGELVTEWDMRNLAPAAADGFFGE